MYCYKACICIYLKYMFYTIVVPLVYHTVRVIVMMFGCFVDTVRILLELTYRNCVCSLRVLILFAFSFQLSSRDVLFCGLNSRVLGFGGKNGYHVLCNGLRVYCGLCDRWLGYDDLLGLLISGLCYAGVSVCCHWDFCGYFFFVWI